MATDLYKQYQESAVTQADPVKLVELMYEGAVKFIRIAARAIDENDPECAHNNILRGYAIVAELMATLDFEQGGEIAAKLEQCYDFVLHLLKEANIKKERKLLDQALSMLEPLLNTWHEAFSGETQAGVAVQGGDNGDSEQPEPAAKRERKPLDIVG